MTRALHEAPNVGLCGFYRRVVPVAEEFADFRQRLRRASAAKVPGHLPRNRDGPLPAGRDQGLRRDAKVLGNDALDLLQVHSLLRFVEKLQKQVPSFIQGELQALGLAMNLELHEGSDQLSSAASNMLCDELDAGVIQ